MMKNEWIQWLALLWLFLLTIINICLIDRTNRIQEEQENQRSILVKQTEIIAINTMMLRAIILPEHSKQVSE